MQVENHDQVAWLKGKYQLSAIGLAGLSASVMYLATAHGFRYAVIAAPVLSVAFHLRAFNFLKNQGVRPKWEKTSELYSIVGTLLITAGLGGWGMYRIVSAPSVPELSYVSGGVTALLIYFPSHAVVGALSRLPRREAVG